MTRRYCLGLIAAPLVAVDQPHEVLCPTVVIEGPRIHRRVTLSDARFYFTGKDQLAAAVERARKDYPCLVIGILATDADALATRLAGVGGISLLKPLPGGATEVCRVSLWEWEPWEIHSRKVYQGNVVLGQLGRPCSVLV